MNKTRKQIFDEVFKKAKLDFKMRYFLKEENHPRGVMPLELILGREEKTNCNLFQSEKK